MQNEHFAKTKDTKRRQESTLQNLAVEEFKNKNIGKTKKEKIV